MITIRKVREEDIDSVAELQVQFTQFHKELDPELYEPKEGYSKIWREYAVKCLTNENKLFILAEDDDEIIGYAIATISKRAPVYKISQIGILDAITVHSDHRKKGTASKLLERCLEWFKENKLKYVEAFVDSRNDGSLKLNEKFGLKEYQKRMILKI